ncbi:MAG: MATE family efflux transporter [Planctomycetaceae bacterium]|nr:MATE family efflux transporter [Planctomycetaceae bacterium]MCA9094658.1 MATE family efflux transporter [Planctomycetaceae bacterium]
MTDATAMVTPNSRLPAGSLRELVHVAFPLVISAGSVSLMNIVDRSFLTLLSVDALAASMPASMLSWTLMSIPFGLAGYTNAFVSQYEGAGKPDRVAGAMWQGLLVALLGGILLLPLIPLSPQIFRWMGHSPDVQKLEVAYFSCLCPVAVPMLVSTVLSSFFTARNRSSVVMWVNLVAAVLNALLDWLLIFGKAGFPMLGIRGAALATLISTGVGTVLFVIVLTSEVRHHGYPFRATFGLDVELLRRMLRYGIPNGIQMLLDVGAFTAFIALIGRLGTREQAATNLAFTLNSLAFVPMLGLGTAVMTLVGKRVGEGFPDLASKTVYTAFYLSGGYMLIFALIYLSLPELILSPFLHGDEKEVFDEIRPIVIVLLRFVAVYTFFDAMAIVFGSAVRGAGDTHFSLVFTVGSSWLLMVLPTLWIIRHDGGLYACWAACSAFIMWLGVGFFLRFLQGHWKSMRVIEHTEAEAPIDHHLS